MAFWSSERIAREGARVNIFEPYDPINIKHGAYEMAVGPEVYTTSSEAKLVLTDRGHFRIPPGQFALILTEEVVTVPSSSIGFISIRASIKFQGLVNVSGFHVDPGFHGRLKFAVYNAGSRDIVLERGQRIFMMWFSDMTDVTVDVYRGKEIYDINSADVSLLQGEVASPAALKEMIDNLRSDFEKRSASIEKDVNLWRGIAIAVLLILLGAIIKPVLDKISAQSGGQQSPATSSEPSARPLGPKNQHEQSAQPLQKTNRP